MRNFILPAEAMAAGVAAPELYTAAEIPQVLASVLASAIVIATHAILAKYFSGKK